MLDDVGKNAGPGDADFEGADFDDSADADKVGSFRFFFDTRSWEWSDEVARLHGYAPGEVEPTTELLAGHKHPDDRNDFEHLVEEMATNHSVFSSRHRIIDTRGEVHHIMVIGQPIVDESGTPIGTEGFYLDMDGLDSRIVKAQIDHHVNRFRKSQGVIEQTKGMIMFTYRVSADQAFEVLKWRSQVTNVKVSILCRNIIAGSQAISIPDSARHSFDHLLLTAHQDTDTAAPPTDDE